MAEVVNVAVRAEAAKHPGARWGINGEALGSDGDFAIVSDPDMGALAPDKGPPWAGWNRTEDGAVFATGQLTSDGWGGAQFPVDLVVVDVRQELVNQPVGTFEFPDVIGSQQCGEAFLPIVMAALDFSFGLWGGSEAQSDAVEVQRGAQLSQRLGGLGVEEGVVVDVENQWQAVGLEGAG